MVDDLRKQLDKLLGEDREDSRRESDADELRRAVRQARKRNKEKRSETAGDRTYRRNTPHRPSKPTPEEKTHEGKLLEEVVPGETVETSGGRKAYRIERRIAELQDETLRLAAAFAEALDSEDSGLSIRLKDLTREKITPHEIIFMDLETTGLSSSPLFLVGTMEWSEGEFIVRQYLARDYSEEKGTITQFNRRMRQKKLLVTFNGKSFDIPFLRARGVVNSVDLHPEPPHFDLLHVCRRAWKEALPNCKLQTLEARICGRPRFGDIPGAEIPAAYHSFVRTGNPRRMIKILKHNMLDLVTMADLMVRLPGASEQ